MRYEGQITENILDPEYHPDRPAKLMVDAEPHIMARLRNIFDNAHNFYGGKYTHKPIVFAWTLSACRDLIWLLDRYSLEVEPALLKRIKDKAEEYDIIVKSVIDADQDNVSRVSKDALTLSVTLRDHQIKFQNMFRKMKRMLLADKMGLGKTISAISTIIEPGTRPTLVVVPAHLCSQWQQELKRCLPDITTHVIRGFKNYDLPKVDVIITSYNRLSPWQDVIVNNEKYPWKTIIFDEVHEVRHTGTQKRNLSKILSENATYVLGLSGTPIYNQGDEIWSIMDVIKPGCMGEYKDFEAEWCTWGKVHEPATLNNYLKSQGLMLRRLPDQVGLKFGEATKQVITIDADLGKLHEIQNVAKLLALSVLSGNVGEDSEASREFDWKLRHATGVAKAKPVAEFVKMLIAQGEKVLLAGWHRDVYDIWLKELSAHNPVMFTGSESPKEKEESVKKFVEGNSDVFIISNRSGSGLDGLQRVCNTCVVGELDWSPHVMDQILARVDRDGQTKHVMGYYLTIADGADPFMVNVLGGKRSQHDGVIEGKQSEGQLLETKVDNNRVRDMAKAYLASIGEEIPESVEETGLLGDTTKLIRNLKLPNNTEVEMQEALDVALKGNLTQAVVEREAKITKRSKLDFLLTQGTERIAIECKINQTKRAEVYRQVRRYVEEGNITSLILVAPWHGVASFKVDGVPVIVIDTNINQI